MTKPTALSLTPVQWEFSPLQSMSQRLLAPRHDVCLCLHLTSAGRVVGWQAGVDYPELELLQVPEGTVTLGKPSDFPSFGWDNEYGSKEMHVKVRTTFRLQAKPTAMTLGRCSPH